MCAGQSVGVGGREARTPLWWRQVLILLNSALKPCLEYPYSCEFGEGDLSWPSYCG